MLPASLMWLSCSSSSSTSSSTKTSGVEYRALITNSVSAGSLIAGVYIVNAETDVRAAASPISAGNTPGMMVLTPNRAQTLVFSGSGTQSSDNQFTIINNATESAASHVILPGMTESFVVSPDSSTAYVAVPTAPVVGQSPGVVEVISLNSGAITGVVDIPSVHYLSIDNSGNRIFGFSDNSDSVAVITPSNIGIPGSSVVTSVGGFDHPVCGLLQLRRQHRLRTELRSRVRRNPGQRANSRFDDEHGWPVRCCLHSRRKSTVCRHCRPASRQCSSCEWFDHVCSGYAAVYRGSSVATLHRPDNCGDHPADCSPSLTCPP